MVATIGERLEITSSTSGMREIPAPYELESMSVIAYQAVFGRLRLKVLKVTLVFDQS